jgi:hypothetical protein
MPPASIAASTPTQTLPLESETLNPAIAPRNIMPSTPRLSMPERSAKISPIAANSRIVPVASPACKMTMGSIRVYLRTNRTR